MELSKVELLPVESMTLTIAGAQLERGETPSAELSAVLVMALNRLKKDGPYALTQASTNASPPIIKDNVKEEMEAEDGSN